MTATAQLTATQFLALEHEPSASRHELIDGEVVVSEQTWKRNTAQFRITGVLYAWMGAGPGRGHAGVPLDVLIDDRNVFVPDVVWYREGRVPGRDDPPPYPVPDLVVEVRSPSTWRFDVGAKKSAYERHGAAELWLVDTAADVVLVYRRSQPSAPRFDVALELGSGETLTSPLLPGLELAVGDVLAD